MDCPGYSRFLTLASTDIYSTLQAAAAVIGSGDLRESVRESDILNTPPVNLGSAQST